MWRLEMKSFDDIEKDIFGLDATELIDIIGDDHCAIVRTNASYAETKVFVDAVMQNGVPDSDNINYVDLKMVFATLFLNMFTDFPVPMAEDGKTIDGRRLYGVIQSANIHRNLLNRSELYAELWELVNKQTEYKILQANRMGEDIKDSINAVGYLANKGVDLLTVFLDKADEAGGLKIADGVQGLLGNLDKLIELTGSVK
jgi:hypothetical protein